MNDEDAHELADDLASTLTNVFVKLDRLREYEEDAGGSEDTIMALEDAIEQNGITRERVTRYKSEVRCRDA